VARQRETISERVDSSILAKRFSTWSWTGNPIRSQK